MSFSSMPGPGMPAMDDRFARHPVQMAEAPDDGAMITVIETDRHVVMGLLPTTPLDALTIVLPASGRMGQRFTVSTTQDVVSLTMVNVDFGSLSSLNAGDCFVFYRQSETQIHRVIT